MTLQSELCTLNTGKEMVKESQVYPCLEPQQDPCVPAHNEIICHAMGEKRQHYLNEVKKILDKLDNKECPTKSTIETSYGSGAAHGMRGRSDRPMIKYPGYVDRDSPKFKQPFYVPSITNVPVKEYRPTSEIWRHKGENSPILEYVSVDKKKKCAPWALRRKKSYELRGGILFRGCDCSKHNGLQDRCERTDCFGIDECLTRPSPTCPPSQTFEEPPHQRPKEDMVREVISLHKGTANKTYCCCPAQSQYKDRTIDGKRYPDCNHATGPGKFECYKCRQ